ncbi:MAG: DUF1223 domain-containing protein [Burkholderiales bacterium]|nr:DUF1223 domain-containing protein [Burkholderiales bacterium]
MKLRRIMLFAFSAASSAVLPLSAFSACDARSGPETAALVELYTSEGCSSCPPADQQLSRLREALDPAAAVVPIALHVGYWDYIGWKDPYAQASFAARQSWLVHANRKDVVYTPQFFVGGTELRSWRGALGDRVRKLNAVPAVADIRVHADIAANGALALKAEAKARNGSEPAVLYLALAESGLVSKVTSGENGGVTLAHDHVVREWVGPVHLRDGAARVERNIALPAAWNRARLEVVAFVQDERSGSVLQALSARQCAAS